MLIAAPAEWTSEADFAAEMTNRQFAALRLRLGKRQLSEEVAELLRTSPRRRARNCDVAEVKKWTTNGWNTEQILRLSSDLLPAEQLVNALQWAFPQAYYSTFALTLAAFKATGLTETSHASVIRRYGELVADGRYPACMAFTADGVQPITFEGTAKAVASSTLAFNPADPESVNTQIAQFLKGTREKDLRERKRSVAIKGRGGKRKKSFTRADWVKVSESLGRTSLLSLLYRKRIKSNYQEIDTFLNPNINADTLFADLIHVASCLNFTHEALIARAIGLPAYRQLQGGLPSIPTFLERRNQVIERIVATASAA